MGYDRDLADRLRACLSSESGITEKAMFGGLAFLVGGHLAVAAGSDGGLMLRCDPVDTATLSERPGAAPMIMRGREMTGWLRVDASALDTEEALATWAGIGAGYARSLPSR